jgi:hypothetical protein
MQAPLLSGISGTWYGYKFRCISDGLTGRESVLKFSNKWTGAVSSAWENPANWSCNIVPDAYTDVVINSGIILINSNPTIHSLTTNPSVVVTVGAGYNFNILH